MKKGIMGRHGDRSKEEASQLCSCHDDQQAPLPSQPNLVDHTFNLSSGFLRGLEKEENRQKRREMDRKGGKQSEKEENGQKGRKMDRK